MRTLGRLGVLLALSAVVVQSVNPRGAEVLWAGFGEGVQQQLAREGWFGQNVIAEPVPDGAAKIPVPTGAGKRATVGAPASAAPAGKSSSHEFATLNGAGVPARWRTCAEIPVVVSTAGAPAGVVSELRAALTQLNAATGLRFTITDTRSRALSAYDSDNPATPVLVGFPAMGAGVFTDASMAGLTSTAVDPATNAITGGTVAFNADLLGTYTPGATGADPRSALLLHELGHLAGLAHVQDSSQVMYPYTGTGYARTFGVGDLAGLHALAPRC